MRKIIQLTIKVSIVFIILGCNLTSNKNTGITISISNNSRVIKGDFTNLDVSTYTLSGVEAKGDVITPVNFVNGSATIKNINPGVWTFTVSAYNSDNLLLYQGSNTYTINFGDILNEAIALVPSGSGDVIFNFDWNSIDSPVLSVKATNIVDSSVTNIVPVISGNTATVKQNLPSGVYILNVDLSSDVSGSNTVGIQSEIVGNYNDTLVVLNQSYSVNISIPTVDNISIKAGTTFRMTTGTFGLDYSLTIYNGKYDFDEIRQTEILYKEKGQTATYSTVINSGVKKLNLSIETSSSIDKGIFTFTFNSERSGTYTFTSSSTGLTFSGDFIIYDKEYLPGEFYLMENNASIIDLNTSNRYVTEYSNNVQKIYPVPNGSNDPQPASSLFAYTADQVAISQMYPESGAAPYYTGIEINNANNSALRLKYYFLSKYKGIVEYSYTGGPTTATPDIAPFNFNVTKETTTNGGNGNNFYRWNFTEVYNLDGGSNDLYANDFSSVNSINNKVLNITFEGTVTNRVLKIYDLASAISQSIWCDIIGANSLGEIVIAVKYDTACDTLLGISSVFDNGEIVYLGYNHANKTMKLYKGNSVLTGSSEVLTLGNMFDVTVYNNFQPTNKYLVLQSVKLDLTEEFGPYNDSRLAFGPTALGYYFSFAQDEGTNPLPVNNSTEYAGFVKSFNKTSSSTADLEYYISDSGVKPGTYNLKFMDINNGIFERFNNIGALVTTGMFNTSSIVGGTKVKKLEIPGVFDFSTNAVQFIDSGESFSLAVYPPYGFVFMSASGNIQNIEYSMLEVSPGIVAVNLNSIKLSGIAASYQKDWYIVDSNPSPKKLYMTNDIMYYMNGGDLSDTNKVLSFDYTVIPVPGF